MEIFHHLFDVHCLENYYSPNENEIARDQIVFQNCYH